MRKIVAMAVALVVSVADAETRNWINVLDPTAEYLNAANWQGSSPAVSADDAAVLAPLEAKVNQRITITPPENGCTYSLSLASIQGDVRHALHLANKTQNKTDESVIAIGDPSGFAGFWTFGADRVLLSLAGGDELKPTLASVSAVNRVGVSVASGTARLEVAEGGGVVVKSGSGALEIGDAGGNSGAVYVDAGSVVFDGAPLDEAELLRRAAMHLDADQIDTFEFEHDDARGVDRVECWRSANGSGLYAASAHDWTPPGSAYIPIAERPFIAPDGYNGHRLVDFGGVSPSRAVNGVSNGMLKLSMSLQNIREIFYVGKYTQDVGVNNVIGGGTHLLRSSGHFYDTTYAHVNAMLGVICLDGDRRDWNFDPRNNIGKIHVMSTSTLGDVTATMLGTDRGMIGRTGGVQIGEMLIYTNALTAIERARVNRYLVRKWIKNDDENSRDVRDVVLESGTSLGVAAGGVLRAEAVNPRDGTLVKTGAGELRVEALPDSTKIDIRGGTVSLASPQTDVPSVIEAADLPQTAYIWLDATVPGSFEYSTEAGVAQNSVSRWKDRRVSQTEIYAELPVGYAEYKGTPPVRTENAVGTNAAVGFGTGGKSDDGSWMKLNVINVANACEAYTAIRFNQAHYDRNHSIFGSTSVELTRLVNCDYGLLDWQYSSLALRKARWTLDGAVVNPLDRSHPLGDKWHVVSFASSAKTYVNLLAHNRINQNENWGGVEIGELIVFDEPLSSSDRTKVEAYLVNKWLGKRHSAQAKEALPGLKFDVSTPVLLSGSVSGTISELEGGNGEVVKDGSGEIVVASERPLETLGSGTTSIAVKGGSLTATFVDPVDREAAFHFDASDASTVNGYVTEDGARTNVLQWADVRGNGLVATAHIDADPDDTYAVAFTNPVWRTVTSPAGTGLPVMDMGEISRYNGTKDKTSSGSAAFIFSQRFTTVRETFIVYADHPARIGACFFGDSAKYQYLRGGGGTLFDTTYAKELCAADIYVDGETAAPTDVLQPGFHLLNFVPDENTSVHYLARDRGLYGGSYMSGGCYVGEAFGFTNVLSSAKREYLTRLLRWKWLGVGTRPSHFVGLDSIAVASGGRLVLRDTTPLSVSALSGNGTLVAAAVTDIAALNPESVGPEAVPMAVSGSVRFANEVVLTVPAGCVLKKEVDYPILTATSIENFDPAAWRIVAPGLKGEVSVRRVGNAICLHVSGSGMVIIVR